MTSRILFPNTTRRPPATSKADPRPPTLALTIVLHPQLHRVGERCELPGLQNGRSVELSRLTPEFRTSEGRLVGPIDDPYVSRTPLRVTRRSNGEIQLEPAATKSAPVWVDGALLRAPFTCDLEALRSGVIIDLAGRVLVLLHTHDAAHPAQPKYGLAGESGVIDQVRADIACAAALPLPVLIRGESGTGKELVARAIHAASPRAARPYVALNMAALNPQTAVAELFGHARGAFTGAVQAREGHFRDADGGTLFLDEIGEAPIEIQVMLLRTIESGEVQPVGGRPGRRVDVRLLAATDANLERAVLDGGFRISLLHRLAGYELHVPPLRRRRDDIARLLVHFLEHELRRAGQAARFDALAADTAEWLPTKTITAFLRHDWPGNVRQLSNVARRMVGMLLAGRPLTDIAALVGATAEHGPEPAVTTESAPSPRAAAELSDDAVMEAMHRHAWQISATARALGISRKALYARIDQSVHMRKARDLPLATLEAERDRHGGDLVKTADALQISLRALRLRLRELQAPA